MAVQALSRKTYLTLLTDAIREAGVQQKAPTSISDTSNMVPRFVKWLDQAYVDLQDMKDWGWRRKTTEILLPPGALRLHVRDRDFVRVYAVDATGPTFTEYTDEASDPATDDVLPFPASPATGDYIVFGSEDPISSIHFNVGTAGVGTFSFAWEYYDEDGNWTALATVTDGTDSFKTAGQNSVTWTTSPTDWAPQSLNGTESLYYLRAVLTWTSDTVDPLISRVQIDGTEDFDEIIHSYTNGRSPKFLNIRTLDSKSDLGVTDNDAIGKVYHMNYQQWRGTESKYFSLTASVPTWYTTLPDRRLEFNRPADADYGITISYMEEIKEMTADGDYPTVPRKLQDILVWMTVLNYMGWDEAAPGFKNAFRRYQVYLKRMNKDWLPTITLRPFDLSAHYD